MKRINFLLLFFIVSQTIYCQKISIFTDSISSSLRGLSVVNNNIVWVSGSKGTVGKSIDAGKSWKWMKVKGFGKTDFRDIEAFDENTAVIMGVDTPAFILRTIDGGINWKVVYENHSKGMFLDAMDFMNNQDGIVLGDPINQHFFIAKTFDGGKTWQNLPEKDGPRADSGEACFAASGTNIRLLGKSDFIFISGGLTSHVFLNNHKVLLPLLQGKGSTGANSIALKNNKIMIAVGGDFMQKEDTIRNCALSVDGGYNWILPKSPPSGYRSCVEFLSNNQWITCGLNGVDISIDNGMNWQKISNQSFNVVRKAKKGNSVYFAGSAGIMGKLEQ
ncbi:MAG: oxidoreductase [Ginsengibacter sp.]